MSAAGEAQSIASNACRMRDGTQIVYQVLGNDSQRRLVLIHSLAMDRHFWDEVVERLPTDVCVLVYDCRGHGASDKAAGPYTIELFADDLADLMDHLGWPRAVVAGASMGGSAALAFGTRHPARTAALGLIDTTAWYGPDAPSAWNKRANAALDSGIASLIDFQTTRWFSEQFRSNHPHVVTSCVETFLRNDVRAYAETCRMLGNFDLRAKLSDLKMPACVIVGEEDYATPIAMAEELNVSIKNSTLTVLRAARHLTPLERPDEVTSELLRLLAVQAG